MHVLFYILLPFLLVLWFAVLAAGSIIGPAVIFVLKRVFGWSPHEANHDELFVVILSGAAVLTVCLVAGAWWILSR